MTGKPRRKVQLCREMKEAEIKTRASAIAARRLPLATEIQMYANLRDAVKLLNELVERNKLHLNESETEQLWRLRFVTRIDP